MSDESSKGTLGRTSQAIQQNSTEPSGPADATSSASGRKRSNTKHRILTPAIHLSLKTSPDPARSGSTVDLNHEVIRTPRATGTDPKAREPHSGGGSSSHSGYSQKYSRSSPSSGYVSSRYGTRMTSSPLTESPASLSSSAGEMLSTSLPAMISPLSVDVEFDLSSFGLDPPRTPSRDQPSSSPLTSHARSNLRVPAASTSSSRKSSAASLDREAVLHLDIKRLLSKPAKPSHSGSSIISLPSDHELSSSSPSPRNPRTFAEMSRRSDAKARTRSGNATDGSVSSSPLHTLREVSSRASLPAAAAEAERKAVQKTRNVLRRKPSARSNPATPTVTTFRTGLEDPNTTPRSSRTIQASNIRSTVPRRTTSAMAEPVSVHRVRRNNTTPAGLTPAGQVALAYKQQEQRREELAEVTGWNEQLRQEDSYRSDDSPLRGTEEDDEVGSGAYYTVFGSTTGKVVAVGSAGDSSWDLDFDAQLGPEDRARLATKQGTGSTSSKPTGVRNLSRKVSGKFKRVAGSVRRDREVSPHGHRRFSETGPDSWTPYDGRPSMAEKSSIGTPKRSLGASMDEFVDVQTQVSGSIPSVPNGRGERLRKEKTLRVMRSFKGKEKEVDKGKEDEVSPGGKLWKLVKRISTGGLRDKYVRDTSPPPVPALPKDLQQFASSRTTLDIRHPSGRESPAQMSVSRFIQSRSSMSAVRPSSAPQKGSPRSERPSSRPSTGARPSTTTRSSSPMSSDIASARFFHRTHSARSSISSYGEELPPIPHGGIGHHIMSPSELYKLNKDSSGEPLKKISSRNRTRSQSAAAAPASHTDEQPPSLPPPRRSNTAGKPSSHRDHESRPPSPTIPAFNTLDPINNFPTPSRLSLPTSEFGILSESTPPRPRRSSRRKPPPPELTSSTISTPGTPPLPSPRTPRSPTSRSMSVDVSGSSIISSGKDSLSLSASHTRSPLRFREMEVSRSPLSEREKVAKWDDLLERSDRAGGTLHLGESGLMSDNVRFSDYSGISDSR